MLSHYTWGQFFFFTALLVAVYYLGVGVLYYRDELTGLLRGRRTGSRAIPTPAGAPPALVRTTSAFAPVEPTPAAAGEKAAENAQEGATANLPEPAAPLVAGTLPDSTEARGTDAAAAHEVPESSEVASAVEQEQHLDEQRPADVLDEADQALAALIRQAGAAAPATPAPLEGPALANAELANDTKAIEINTDKSNNELQIIETTKKGVPVEGETVYSPVVADATDPLAGFEEVLASPLDLLAVGPEPLVEADSLAAFLAEVQRGAQPPVPAELLGTSLAEQMADLTRQNQQELLALFGQEA